MLYEKTSKKQAAQQYKYFDEAKFFESLKVLKCLTFIVFSDEVTKWCKKQRQKDRKTWLQKYSVKLKIQEVQRTVILGRKRITLDSNGRHFDEKYEATNSSC